MISFRAFDNGPLALVADDEPLVRSLVCSALSAHGWRTVEAGDGATALRMVAELGVDLMITDYEMPAISGLDLAHSVHQLSPTMPIVVMSGQSLIAALVKDRGFRFLPKPFDVNDLMTMVTALVDVDLARRPAPDSGIQLNS